MRNLPPAHVGDLVRARRLSWRVLDATAHDACHVVALGGAGPSNASTQRRLLTPFDIVEPIQRAPRARQAKAGAWQAACRALFAGTFTPHTLRTAQQADIALLPHQLEPALAVVRGAASRILLADDVGLGKTIQAGLIVAELIARGIAGRVLVLTPAGLRDQWAGELARRFRLQASIVDVAAVRAVTASLPVGMNPWLAVPLAIASIDYVKRAEVLPAVAACRWDVVVIDEAHGVVGDSARHAAASVLAASTSVLVLATATPHSGDRTSFDALRNLGARADDALIAFRRTRHDVKLAATRRIHRLHVRLSDAERRMHHQLAAFSAAVQRESARDASLALSVLYKRAFSSAHSLERSVARRLDALRDPSAVPLVQLALPLDLRSGAFDAEDDAPGWSAELALEDVERERRLLGRLAGAARTAARSESKVAAIARLLRRLDEPAIVFTEYRDTLQHLARRLESTVVLHGGMTRDERAEALDAFARGRQRVLLATDAAGQGVNLHHTARVVINLELPWNPMRLEQRIGRVDRIGQPRTVHAFHLIASGTREVDVFERLKARVARAAADIAAPDPLGTQVEHRLARLVASGASNVESDETVEESTRLPIGSTNALAADARAEAVRHAAARHLVRAHDADALSRAESGGPLVAVAHRWRTRRRLTGSALLLYRVTAEDGCGRPIASGVVAMLVEVADMHLASASDRRAAFEGIRADAREHALRDEIERAVAPWQEAVARHHAALVDARRRRAQATTDRLAGRSQLFQPGLFDRRREYTQVAARAEEARADADGAAHRLAIERSGAIHWLAPRLILLLVPR